MALLHRMVLQKGFEPKTFQRSDIDRHDFQHPLRIATSNQRVVDDSLLLPLPLPLLALRCLSMLMTRWLFLHIKLLTIRSRCDSCGSSLGSLLLSTSGIVSNFMFDMKSLITSLPGCNDIWPFRILLPIIHLFSVLFASLPKLRFLVDTCFCGFLIPQILLSGSLV